MDMVDIRKATLGDSSAIADLSTQLGYPSTARQISDRLERILNSKEHAILIACLPNRSVVGWVHVFLTFRVESDPFAELGGFVVSDGFRRIGIGKCLWAEVEKWVVQNAITKIRVRSRSNRLEAHGFYERLGFSKSKHQHVFDMSVKSDAEPSNSPGRESFFCL